MANAQRAGTIQRPTLPVAEVEGAINLGSLQEVPGTLEAVARAVAGGRLDFKAGNTVVLAVNGAASAYKAMADIDERRKKLYEGMTEAELEEAIREALDAVRTRAGQREAM